MPSDDQLTDQESSAIAALIREELARRRCSRQFLADQAKISISTLEKALSGRRPFTLATTIRLEQALGLRLRKIQDAVPEVATPTGIARDDLGSYARRAVSWIEGDYAALRPSFGEPGSIYAYRIEIRWADASSSLEFRESERLDTAFTQHGFVSMPNQSGHVYLVTNNSGQYRLYMVSRPTISGEMYGILSTLQAGRGSQLIPVAAPIALVPIGSLGDIHFGRIKAGHPAYVPYRQYLDRTIEEPFARFFTD